MKRKVTREEFLEVYAFLYKTSIRSFDLDNPMPTEISKKYIILSCPSYWSRQRCEPSMSGLIQKSLTEVDTRCRPTSCMSHSFDCMKKVVYNFNSIDDEF